jgi:long-subunit fatty acid transport protein
MERKGCSLRLFSTIALFSLPIPAIAGSISAPAVVGGVDASSTTVSPVAIHWNPGALGASTGLDLLMDTQLSVVSVQATATRNDGIDPNTGEPYRTATAEAKVPVFVLGVTYRLPESVPWVGDRLTLGLSAMDTFVGGGDYTSSEVDSDGNPADTPPYTSHQRYAGINTKIITLKVTPAIGLTLMDGLHIGGGFSYVADIIEAMQASDTIGSEGNGLSPYSNDSILEASGSGSHTTWNAGIFFNRIEQFQVGLSYSAPGAFNAAGDAKVSVAQLLGGMEVDGLATFDMPLPAVVRGSVASQVNSNLKLGAGFEYQLWSNCCGGPEGDLRIGLTDLEGGAIDSGEGLTPGFTIATEQFSPRRLQNSLNLYATAEVAVSDAMVLGSRFGWNQSAVPDYAVSATNLDFTSLGGGLSVDYQVAKRLKLGASFTKFIPQTRTITNSAWDATKGTDVYVDDRFSPSLPNKANTDGVYSAQNNTFGLRLRWTL